MIEFHEHVSIKTPKAAKGGIKPRKPALHVVGQERDHVLLLARDDCDSDGEWRTFIESFDIMTQARTVLYTHEPGTMKVVSASVNPQRTIVAFTTRRSKSGGEPESPLEPRPSREENYVSFLAETLPNRRFFDLNIRRPHLSQRIQFLHFEARPSKAESSFLFFLDKERVELYTIETEDRGRKHPTISSQPDCAYHVCFDYLWFEFFPQQGSARNILYTLSLAHGPGDRAMIDGSPRKSCETVVRCCTFRMASKKPEVLWEANPHMELPRRLLGSDSAYCTFPWRNGTSSPEVNLALHVVQLDYIRGAPKLVLCQQHMEPPSRETIAVSLYCIAPRRRLDLTLCLDPAKLEDLPPDNSSIHSTTRPRFSTRTPRVPEPLRVWFGAVNGLLVLYVPDHCLHLVDCFHPQPIASWTAPPELPPSPGGPTSLVTSLTFGTTPVKHMFLDLRSPHGISLYSYAFQAPMLQQVARNPAMPPLAYVQCIHMAARYALEHPQSLMVWDVLAIICETAPHRVTFEFVVESLLGLLFVAVCEAMTGPVMTAMEYAMYLQAIPTSSAFLRAAPRAEFPVSDPSKAQVIRRLPLPNPLFSLATCLPAQTRAEAMAEAMAGRTTRRRVPSDEPPATGRLQTLSQRLKRIWHTEEAMCPLPPEGPVNTADMVRTVLDQPRPSRLAFLTRSMAMEVSEPLDSYAALQWQFFEEYVADQLAEVFPGWSQKPDCVIFAKAYRTGLKRKSEKFTNFLLDRCFLDAHALFLVCQDVGRAHAELSIPLPPRFAEAFAQLGRRCLPRHTFVQYVQRGILPAAPPPVPELPFSPIQLHRLALATPPNPWASRARLWADTLTRLEEQPTATGLLLRYYHSVVEGPSQLASAAEYDGEDEDAWEADLEPPRTPVLPLAELIHAVWHLGDCGTHAQAYLRKALLPHSMETLAALFPAEEYVDCPNLTFNLPPRLPETPRDPLPPPLLTAADDSSSELCTAMPHSEAPSSLEGTSLRTCIAFPLDD